MTAEQLQNVKDFFKSMGLPLPKGLGVSPKKEIKSGVAAGFDRNTASKSGTVEDGMWYPDYDEGVNQTLPAVYDPDAPAPDYEQEFYGSGDSFADIVEKRASAPEPPDAFPARVRDGMDIMRQKSRAREEAALAGDGPAPEPPDAFPARVRDGMDIMRQKSRAREEAALAGDGPAPEQDDTEAFDKLFGTVDGEVPEQDDTEAFDKLFGTVGGEVGQPAETPTVEEMNSRNEEFGDSFDFMEGSEEYPAGRDKKSDRKAERRDRKAHLKSSKKAFGTKSRDKSRKSKGGYVDPQGGEPLTTTEAGRTIDEIGAPERGLGDYAADAMAESAEPAPEVNYTDQAIALFKNTHGTSFDPKSSMDKGKLEKMKAILAERGGLGEMSPNQFALQVYRSS